MVKCAGDEATVTYETYERLCDSMGLFQVFLHVLERTEKGRGKKEEGKKGMEGEKEKKECREKERKKE